MPKKKRQPASKPDTALTVPEKPETALTIPDLIEKINAEMHAIEEIGIRTKEAVWPHAMRLGTFASTLKDQCKRDGIKWGPLRDKTWPNVSPRSMQGYMQLAKNPECATSRVFGLRATLALLAHHKEPAFADDVTSEAADEDIDEDTHDSDPERRYAYQLAFVRDFLRRQNIPTRSECEAEREAVIYLFDQLQRRALNTTVEGASTLSH